VEETAVGAVELIQSVDGVLTGMAMYHIQQDNYTTPVRHVNQLLQLIRRPIPTTTSVMVTYITSRRRCGQTMRNCYRNIVHVVVVDDDADDDDDNYDDDN